MAQHAQPRARLRGVCAAHNVRARQSLADQSETHSFDGRMDGVAGERAPAPSIAATITRTDIPYYPHGAAFVLHNFLTPAECEAYTNQAELIGLRTVQAQGYGARMRVCHRAATFAPSVADELTARVLPHVGSDVTIEANEYGYMRHQEGIVPNSQPGHYTPYGCNPGVRVCRYTAGGHFQPHHDGQFVAGRDERSFKTVMCYLNDGFEGGNTRFFDGRQGKYAPPRGEYVVFEYTPRRGDCLVFNHHLLHDGGKVTAGTKYIMRTELMYRHRAADELALMGLLGDHPGDPADDGVEDDPSCRGEAAEEQAGPPAPQAAPAGAVLPAGAYPAATCAQDRPAPPEGGHGAAAGCGRGGTGPVVAAGNAGNVWCLHVDCLASVELYHSQTDLAAHTVAAHAATPC